MNPRAPQPHDPTGDPSAREIEISEGRVHVRIFGAGRPVLFLHGVSAHGRSWQTVAGSFCAANPGWACWVPDMLGRGRSDAEPGLRYALDDEVRRTRELVAALCEHGPAPSLVAGHSQGAAVALALAAVEPRVRGLLLSNPVTADIRRPPVLSVLDSAVARAALGRAFAPLHGALGRLILRRAGGPHYPVPDEAVEAYAAPYADPVRARTLMRILSDWRPSDLERRMPRRPLAAHVVAGAHDPRIPVRSAERLALDLDCDLTVVEDGGHVLPEQHPERLAERLADLATRVRASEA